ncbi:ribbon-helix-helix domain-containing protein [Candidatus Saccharibacteria bacterium]|nr:ribbon-helix-helix domain-containing protein [Candidatus Saccharibacteria bacterium]
MNNSDLNTEKMKIIMPGNMLAQIDAQIGGGFTDREEFMRAAARHYLEYLRALNDTGDSSIG